MMANEKRLIDANALAKEIDFEYDLNYGEILTDPRKFAEMVEDASTVDAVEVVRCKDCIHRVYVDMGDDIREIGGCELFGCAMPYDAFCSYGERKDNG